MKRIVPLSIVAALALAAPAFAQVPQTMSYQGILTDNNGVLVPDGSYAMTFRLYTTAIGGAALWTQANPGIAVSKGGFSVTLGLPTPLTLAFDTPYYLGIQVGADPELVPRISLASAPYSLSLRLPFTGSANSATSGLEISNLGAGPAITADGLLKVGATIEDGELDLYRVGSVNPILRAYDLTDAGAALDAKDELGNFTWYMEPDNAGTGGFLGIRRSAGSDGFVVDGNFSGNEPRVTIAGATRSMSFNPGAASADASVVLPNDAIAATEIFDEPGVAAGNGLNGGLTFDGTVQTLAGRTITCPSAGYVVAIANSEVIISHAYPGITYATIGVSNTPNSFPTTQDIGMNMPGEAPSGIYHYPGPAVGVFPVSAGASSFYYLGQGDAGDVFVYDATLALMFFPTAYGTVTPTGPTTITARVDKPSGATSAGLSAEDIRAEQAEAKAFDSARMQHELNAMRLQVAELQRQLDESVGAQLKTSAATKRSPK